MHTTCIRSFVIFTVLLFCSGCTVFHHYDDIHGALLDAEDGKPVQAATVICKYYIERGTVGGNLDENVALETTTTDLAGRFIFPGKFVFAPRLPYTEFDKQPRIYISADGYESVTFLNGYACSNLPKNRIPIGTEGLYKEKSIVSVVMEGKTKVYEFRVGKNK